MKNGIKDALGFSFLKRSEKSQASLASHSSGLMNLHRLIQILFLSLALVFSMSERVTHSEL